jgi:hypothetical protein
MIFGRYIEAPPSVQAAAAVPGPTPVQAPGPVPNAAAAKFNAK